MRLKGEIRPKYRLTLVILEMIGICVFGAYMMTQNYKWDTFTGVIAAVVIFMILAFLFFRVRIFRYIFSIAFSLCWAIAAYNLTESFTDARATRWIAAAIVFLISAFLHKDYFDFERPNP